MLRKLNLILLLTVNALAASSQDTIPFLKGKVELSIKQGTIECHWVMTNIPRIQDYSIRINAGMNIRYFREGVNGEPLNYDFDQKDSMSSGEAQAYYFASGQKKFLPDTLEIKYTGRYPVFYDSLKDYAGVDWKGNISFNGYSVRADGWQTGWYPYLYDVKKDKSYQEVRYDVEISCADCSTLYVNGNAPVYASKARFTSQIPREMMIFCGNYRYTNMDGTYILNPDLTEQEARDFGKITNDFKKYMVSNLKIPYGDKVTFIRTTPTSQNNGWLFVSFPTIVNINHTMGLKKFMDPKTSDWYRPYLAHELGHYYFGTFRNFNTELGDMIDEGFSEFISFKVTQNLVGDSVYQKKIGEKYRSLSGFNAIPIGKIRSHAEYNNRELYVYYYAPLIFAAIEKEIGEKKMWEWLKSLLETKTDFTNYMFLTSTLETVVKDKAKTDLIKTKYFESEKAMEHVGELLGLK